MYQNVLVNDSYSETSVKSHQIFVIGVLTDDANI